MKKISAKAGARSKGHGRKAKSERPMELDRGWQDLEVQADRLKFDWMSLSVQLGIGGHEKSSYD
ncbi:MAG: hypothetical protein HY079_11325 [Elusimicrobia bacterium]|nr:hypothetical protein [Elusimicrobiota bacterium]